MLQHTLYASVVNLIHHTILTWKKPSSKWHMTISPFPQITGRIRAAEHELLQGKRQKWIMSSPSSFVHRRSALAQPWQPSTASIATHAPICSSTLLHFVMLWNLRGLSVSTINMGLKDAINHISGLKVIFVLILQINWICTYSKYWGKMLVQFLGNLTFYSNSVVLPHDDWTNFSSFASSQAVHSED